MSKLFVGGLSWGTTDDGLRDAFAEFGEVKEAKVITDRETGRSRGFGFVTFMSSAESQAALTAMDGTNLDGRSIRVNVAEEKGRGGGNGPRRDDRSPPDIQHRGFGGSRDDMGGSKPPRR